MGFIYPWEIVDRRLVPTKKDFLLMRDVFIETLNKHSGVLAASVYGSVLRGDFNRRSDLDVAAVCEDEALRTVRATVNGFVTLAERDKHIVLNIRLHSVSQARLGQHPFGPSYVYTMRLAKEQGLAFGRLSDFYMCPFGDLNDAQMRAALVRDEMLRKFRNNRLSVVRSARELERLRSRARIWSDFWLTNCREAKARPLHLYMRFARWMLWYRNAQLADDSKKGVIQAFSETDAFRPLWEDFACLKEMDAEYDRFLERALSRSGVKRSRYKRRTRRLIERVTAVTNGLFNKAFFLLGSSSSLPLKAVA